MTTPGALAALIGGAGEAAQAGGPPRIAPSSIEGCAMVLAEATRRRWRVRLEGRGTWGASDAPADIVLSTRALTGVRDVAPADLVATVEAGVTWDSLAATLQGQRLWLPLDPPSAGAPRSLGSVIATATAGSLRAGFGAVRDHLLGLTMVSGDGRIVRAGGRVAKNVAGYDLTRLAAGSFGAFGLIAEAHVRLRVLPETDISLVARGPRDTLLDMALGMAREGWPPAACDLRWSPEQRDWSLAVRLVGTANAVAAERRALPRELTEQPGAAAPACAGPVTFRLGVPITSLGAALDLVREHAGPGQIAASVPAGAVRWSGTATADALRRLRTAAAARELPLTLERAPRDVLAAVGHFGAYRDGVAALVARLRRAFDPQGTIAVVADA